MVSRTIPLLLCLTLLGAAPSPRTSYLLRGGMAYQVMANGAQVRIPSHAAFSQRGQKYLAALVSAGSHTDLLLLRANSAGRYALVHRVRCGEVDAATAVMSATVLDADRVFVDLHVNPSTSVGVELNTRTFKRDVYMGCGFTWDASRTKLAYFDDGPHFSPEGSCPGTVWVGHRRVKSLPGKVVTGVHWAGGGRLAVEIAAPGGLASGRPRSRTLLVRP